MSSKVEVLLGELFSGDDTRAERAAVRLAGLAAGPQSTVLARLQALLGSSEADRRWWGARTLAGVHDPSVPGWLVGLLEDPEASVRQCAALGLRLQPDAMAVPALVGALGDTDRLVARLAADALVAICEAAVPALIEVAGSGVTGAHRNRSNARLQAVRALALIGDRRAAKALYDALEDDSALQVYWAEQGLERMGVGMVFFNP